MYINKMCLNPVQGGPITSYSRADIRKTPTSGARNGCHGNAYCLAMEPRILHFMIEYLKNAKVYKLKNRQISSRLNLGYMTQFWCK